MREPLQLPSATVAGFITVGDAFARASPPAADATLLERCRTLLDRAPAHAFLSHSTAALVWGAPLPRELERESRLHVSVPAWAAGPHARGVVGHRLDLVERDVTEWGGLRVTSPARTWFDLAGSLALDDLVALGDYFIHHAAPFTDRVELALLLGRAEGQRGVRAARRALDLLSERSESRSESRLRVALVTSGLPAPEITHPVIETIASTQSRAELLFRHEHVLIVCLGENRRTRTQWRRDMTRRSRLESQGWRVLELGDDDLADTAELVARLRVLFRQR